MKHRAPLLIAGFTLVEALIAAAISSVVFAMLIVGSLALQRTFLSSDYQATAQNDQLRLCDYLSRDLQSASSVTLTDNGHVIEMTLPVVNANVLSLNLNIPIVGPLLQNETPSTTRQIRYTLEGDALFRADEVARHRIAQKLTHFTATRAGSRVIINAAFSPKFTGHSTSPHSFEITRTITLRNING
jgi:type II secretory pathway component PulJ